MEDQDSLYLVVVNHEEQFSIWPCDRVIPDGWRKVGKKGPKSECLEYINSVWSDMRPSSLRRHMETVVEKTPSREATSLVYEPLVDKLCRAIQPVCINLKGDQELDTIREQLQLGYLHLKFSETRGGTELRIRVDKKASDFTHADFAQKSGLLRITGDLVLDYENIRCVAEINLENLKGHAQLSKF